MYLLATRGRPEQVKALIESMIQVGDVPEVAVMVDQEEMGNYASVPWPAHWHVHLSGQHVELTRALNALAMLYPAAPFFGVISDRYRFVMPWSERMKRAAGSYNVAYCDDGWLKGRQVGRPWLPTVSGVLTVGNLLVRDLGSLLLPTTKHLYSDFALCDVADRYGLLRYVPDVQVKVDRPETTGIKADQNAKRLIDGKSYAEDDMKAYQKFLANMPTLSCDRAGRITFALVKGPGDTAERVNVLADMIRRNLPPDFEARFLCLTNEPEDLDAGIDVAFLPPGFSGAAAKICLFSPKMFQPGTRVIQVDLDCVVRGTFDPLLSYRGPLAMADGVMAWGAGECNAVMDAYVLAGMPNDVDVRTQIARVYPKALDLNDLFPSLIGPCEETPPLATRIVTVRGDVPAWVDRVRRKGGPSLGRVSVMPNTSDDEQFANVRLASGRTDVSFVSPGEATGRTLIICGGGPSLREALPEIALRTRGGATIWALNGAARVLADAALTVSAHVILDPRPKNIAFLDRRPLLRLIASVCDPLLIDAAVKSGPTSIFHPLIEGIDAHIPGNAHLIGGGVTVGLTALMLAHVMGYRNIALYGYDSSYRDHETHAYEQALTTEEARTMTAVVDGVAYRTNPVMYAQAEAFPRVAEALVEAGATIAVHGSGLLPAVALAYQTQINAAQEIAA